MQNPGDEFWWVKFVGYGAFAAFAGMCGHLLRTLDSAHKVVWSRVVIEGFAAGFVGVLVYLLCKAMGMSIEWTGVVVGVSGWLGANATIKMLERVVLKKLGLPVVAAAATPELEMPNVVDSDPSVSE